jgi:hypothetical protein
MLCCLAGNGAIPVSAVRSATRPSVAHSTFWTATKRAEKLKYMHRNPVKRGLVKSPEQWRWSSYRFYLLGDNQARRLSSRLLMLLMLKVATFSGSLSVPVLLGVPRRYKRVHSRYSLYPDPTQPTPMFFSNVQFWSESAIGQKLTP